MTKSEKKVFKVGQVAVILGAIVLTYAGSFFFATSQVAWKLSTISKVSFTGIALVTVVAIILSLRTSKLVWISDRTNEYSDYEKPLDSRVYLGVNRNPLPATISPRAFQRMNRTNR